MQNDKKTEVITFRTTSEVYQILKKIAEKEERSVSWIVERQIRKFADDLQKCI